MYPKDFSVVLYLLLIGICAYFLCIGKISGRGFATSLLLCAFAVAILHNLDVIQRLSVKSRGMEATAEFEQIRRDIYAKADSVRQMTEDVAGMIAENVTTSNRYGGSGDPDPIAQQIRYRDKLRQTLKDAGTSEDRTKQLLAPFDRWIPYDLRSAIQYSVLATSQKKGWPAQESNQFQKDLESLLNEEPYMASLGKAEGKIHEAGLSSPEVELDIKRYRVYLETGGPIPPKLRD